MKNISHLKNKLSDTIQTIYQTKNNTIINNIIENLIVDITDSEYCSVWMYQPLILSREREYGVKEISMESKKGLLYKCFATKTATIYNYITSEKGYIQKVDNPDKIKIKSKIMIPLIRNEEFIGIVTAYSSVKKIKNFTNNDLDIFKAVEPFIIDAIEQMQKNNSCDFKENTVPEPYTGKDRRKNNDFIENLDSLKVVREEINNTQEIVNFTSNIVHDIRTPANGLLGFLEILEEQISDSRIKEYIGHAKSSAALINDLTTSILDGVSAKRNLVVDEIQEINSTHFFANIAEIFSANMYKKDINYNIFIDPSLPKEIRIDTMKMKRILMNLISNASKFTPEHGSIEFSVRYKRNEKRLHIFIKDNGIGIAKEKQEEIFEAFKQAEENTKDLFGGTGLGLSICAAYVKEMKGKLLIDSELDKGSTFYFDIPLDVVNDSVSVKPIQNKRVKVAILLNQENSFMANHMIKYLVTLGLNVDNIKEVTSLKQISEDFTHVIAFENKLSIETFAHIEQNSLQLLVVEENFLSLSIENLESAKLISQYSYYGESLYSFVCSSNIPKVLIVEDDQISIQLIRAILKNEYCEIDTAVNGQEGLDLLNQALSIGRPYTIVYSDQNMPLLSGSDMLKTYSQREKERGSHRVKTVSISGNLSRNKNLYSFDYYAIKPFKKQEIVSTFLNSITKKDC